MNASLFLLEPRKFESADIALQEVDFSGTRTCPVQSRFEDAQPRHCCPYILGI